MEFRDETSESSEFIAKGPCESCGSSDACALYDDGHRHCFSCDTHFPAEEGAEPSAKRSTKRPEGLLSVTPIDRVLRGITPETFAKFGYGYGEMSGETVHVAPYRDADAALVAQHVRKKGKDFPWVGKKKRATLFGQHLWRDAGRMLVITEGEIDAMSVSQLQANKYPVVSIMSGASGAKKDIAAQIEWIERFESVVFMFDMDDPGQDAAKECALLLTPGKAKIAYLPLKDANKMLTEGRGREVIDAIWGAKVFRPDGIVTLADIREEALKPIEVGLPWFLESLTRLTHGRRLGELYVIGAGTGVGKTDYLTQQIDYDITVLGEKAALFFLEQQPPETAKRVAGKHAGQRFHVPTAGWTQEEFEEAFDAISGTNLLYLFDHFGCADWDVIASRIRYLAHSEGVKLFYVDHLTALADPSDERGSLERIMGAIGGLVKELNITIHLVSHLTTPDGKSHEEGGRVTIRQFKGSRSIGFWSHFMFGLERDQQAEDLEERQTTTFRVLKDRYTGQATGEVIKLGYDQDSGRLFEKTECDGFGDERSGGGPDTDEF